MPLDARSGSLRSLGWLIFAPILLAGCGDSSENDVVLDPLHLIENFDPNPVRHHPRRLVEIDLGEFSVTMPSADDVDILSIQFHAYAVVPKEEGPVLTDLVERRSSRIHDHVVRLVQRIDPEELSDPNLTWLKSEMIPLLNRVLQSDDVRDVVFGSFSVTVG